MVCRDDILRYMAGLIRRNDEIEFCDLGRTAWSYTWRVGLNGKWYRGSVNYRKGYVGLLESIKETLKEVADA